MEEVLLKEWPERSTIGIGHKTACELLFGALGAASGGMIARCIGRGIYDAKVSKAAEREIEKIRRQTRDAVNKAGKI